MAVRVMGLNSVVPGISVSLSLSFRSLLYPSFNAIESQWKRTCFAIGIGTGCLRNRIGRVIASLLYGTCRAVCISFVAKQ